jgi:hypothetical protein
MSVKIPPQLLNESQILMDVMSAEHPSVTRTIALAAREEWLHAWAICCCIEEENFRNLDTDDLVNCTLVCFLPLERSFHGASHRCHRS